jgi:hypothetical protein
MVLVAQASACVLLISRKLKLKEHRLKPVPLALRFSPSMR